MAVSNAFQRSIPSLIKRFMSKVVVKTPAAPAAVGHYSQAIKANGLVFVSGQIGLDPKSGEFVQGGVAEQTDRILTSLQAILEEAGSSLDEVVKTTVLMADIDDFVTMNDVYAKYFTKELPARAAFAVKSLPKNALVEIECIARCEE